MPLRFAFASLVFAASMAFASCSSSDEAAPDDPDIREVPTQAHLMREAGTHALMAESSPPVSSAGLLGLIAVAFVPTVYLLARSGRQRSTGRDPA